MRMRLTLDYVEDIKSDIEDGGLTLLQGGKLVEELLSLMTLRPISEIHKDYGVVLFWYFNEDGTLIGYPEVRSCLDEDFDIKDHTHFSLIPNVRFPEQKMLISK